MNSQLPQAPKDFERRLEVEASQQIVRTEDELFILLLRSMRGSVGHVDKFVSWCLTGTGATFALIAANLDSLVTFIGQGSLKCALALLALSFLCGVAAKYRGMLLNINTSMDPVLNRIEEIKKEHVARTTDLAQIATAYAVPLNTAIDRERVLKKVFGVFPNPVQWKLNGILLKVAADPLYAQRILAGNIVAQSMWAAGQVVAIALSMFLVAAGV